MSDRTQPPKNDKNDGGKRPNKRRPEPGDKFEWRKATRTLTFWILLVIGSWIVFRELSDTEKSEVNKSYSQYQKLLESGQISAAEIIDREFHGQLQDGTRIITTLPFIDQDMLEKWDELKIDYQFREKTTSWVGYLITSILPWVIIIAIWLYIMRRMQGGGQRGLFSFGKSRAKLLVEDKPSVTFKDVAGVQEAEEELEEIIDFLRDPKKFSKLGGRIPKGALLLGPPGTGKTLLARAVAGEAKVPFFSMSGADFVEMFVGVGASRVRDLFEQGKKNAPCIIFIDEIDAVGRHRGAGLGGGHDEREQTLNQLLVEMDGFEGTEGVILIAATNRPDVLDPALTRPGRFDRQIVVDRPDVRGREGILGVHTRNLPLEPDVKLDVLAKSTPGMSGADIANMANEAALLAARRNASKVSMNDFEEAKDKVMMGAERKSMLISDSEKRQTAFHEAGHVLVSKLTPDADPVHKVTIIPRGRALGLTHYLPLDEKHNYSRTYLLQTLSHLLGGRVAERIEFNELSTGAGNDIERATLIARKMVCEWGMSDRLGPIAFGKKQEEVFLGRDIGHQRDFSERTAQEIDREVRRIVGEAEQEAEKLLRANLDKLTALALALLDREILDGSEIDSILAGKKLPQLKNKAQEHTSTSSSTTAKSKPRPPRRTIKPKPAEKAPVSPRTTQIISSPRGSNLEKKEEEPGQADSQFGSRRQLAKSYGVVSSRDPENQRPRVSQLDQKKTEEKATAASDSKQEETTKKETETTDKKTAQEETKRKSPRPRTRARKPKTPETAKPAANVVNTEVHKPDQKTAKPVEEPTDQVKRPRVTFTRSGSYKSYEAKEKEIQEPDLQLKMPSFGEIEQKKPDTGVESASTGKKDKEVQPATDDSHNGKESVHSNISGSKMSSLWFDRTKASPIQDIPDSGKINPESSSSVKPEAEVSRHKPEPETDDHKQDSDNAVKLIKPEKSAESTEQVKADIPSPVKVREPVKVDQPRVISRFGFPDPEDTPDVSVKEKLPVKEVESVKEKLPKEITLDSENSSGDSDGD